MRLCATTDACVEDVHFSFRTSTPEQVGHKALAMNLSDLAAAGARPRWFLAALGVPAGGRQQARARGLARGMARLAEEHAVDLVGGNVTRAPQWSLTITALGEARRPLSRGGGRPGDLLVLCGALGEAALGLRLLSSDPVVTEALRELGPPCRTLTRRALSAQRTPAPLVAQGLSGAGLASAAIDLSDGLLQDLGHLCSRSGCGARVDVERLPRGEGVVAAEAALAHAGEHAFSLSLSGGEDYALLFAVPPARHARLLSALRKVGGRAHTIGALEDGQEIRLEAGGFAIEPPTLRGFDHLG
jgi:thiamine-monophosphate kinase